MYNWVIDISIYQSLTVAELLTLKANGLAGVIVKSSQGTRIDADLEYNVANLREAGLPFGFYHWCDPISSADPQVELMRNLEARYKPNFWCMDMEQFWSNWGQWYAKYVQHQDIVLDKFSNSYLYNFYNTIFDKANAMTTLPLLVYSAKWFIEGYCQMLPNVISKSFGYWNARYFYWNDANKNEKMSFDEMYVFINAQTEAKLASELPNGVDSWMIWQLCEAPVENIETLDLDIIRPKDTAILFGSTTDIPPVVEPEACAMSFRVLVDTLNVRTGPGTSYTVASKIYKGDVVEGKDIAGSNVWIELGPQRYAAMKINSTLYMELLNAE